jgi:hypothetical protein
MCPSDQNYILHPANPESKPSGPGEPGIDIFDYPLAKLSLRYRVLATSLYWKG